MGQYFAKDYTGDPFVLFGTAHLIALGIVLAVNVFWFLWKNPGERARRNIRYGMAIMLIVNELAWHTWKIAIGEWTVQTMLPFHLCSILVWLTPVMLISKNERLYYVCYFLGIGGALQPLLTPEAGIYGFPHFRFMQTQISHSLLVTAPIFMTAVEKMRPTWKSLWQSLLVINIYGLVILGINFLIGSNYLFINGKPETASLMDVMPDWPYYLIYLEVIAAIMFLILYVPFAVSDWRSQKKSKPAAA